MLALNQLSHTSCPGIIILDLGKQNILISLVSIGSPVTRLGNTYILCIFTYIYMEDNKPLNIHKE